MGKNDCKSKAVVVWIRMFSQGLPATRQDKRARYIAKLKAQHARTTSYSGEYSLSREVLLCYLQAVP